PDQQSDWRAVPILADLTGLTSAHLIVGSLDPLLDDSHRLASRLEEAGVPCDLTVYNGLNHGFIRYGRLISAARRAVGDCATALRKALVARPSG
ncbi:MAG TPA: alpha/beta hydrolase fold domain-containing protein, partial [Stellaceae bacterium]|nr:alpha/beta hydrolase fold domain-containing protein [Stellaceae bacterium]